MKKLLLIALTIILVACESPATPAPTEADTPTTTTAPTDTPVTTSPSTTEEIGFEMVNHNWGATNALVLVGDIAYMGMGPRLITLDISDPIAPQRLGEGPVLPGIINALVVRGGIAYVAAGETLVTVDIFGNMSQIARFDLANTPKDMALRDDTLYLVGDQYLAAIDVSGEAPQLLDSTPFEGRSRSLALIGDTVYFDRQIGVGRTPEYRLSYARTGDLSIGDASMEVSTALALTAVGETLIVGGGEVITFWNGADPTNLTQLSIPEVPIPRGADIPTPQEVLVQGDAVYYLGQEFIDFINLSLTAATIKANFEPEALNASSIAVAGDYVYVAEAGLSVYTAEPPFTVRINFDAEQDYSEPAGRWHLNYYPTDAAVSDGYAYMGSSGLSQSSELVTLTLPDLEQQSVWNLYDTFNFRSGIREVYRDGERLFLNIGEENGPILSLADPSMPEMLVKTAAFGPPPLTSGNFAVNGDLAAAQGTLYDISKLDDPQIIVDIPNVMLFTSAFYALTNDALFIAYADDTGNTILAFIDIAGQETGRIDLGQTNVRSIAARDELVALTTSNGTVELASNPSTRYTLEVPGAYDAIWLDDTTLLVTGSDGLQAFDVSDLDAPRVIGIYNELPADLVSITTDGEWVLLSGKQIGLVVLRIKR